MSFYLQEIEGFPIFEITEIIMEENCIFCPEGTA
jgi:hypothetical protein